MKKIFMVLLLVSVAAALYAEDYDKKLKMLERRIAFLEIHNMSLQVEVYLNRIRIKQANLLTNRNVNVIRQKYHDVAKLDKAHSAIIQIKKNILKLRKKILRTKDLKTAEKLYNQAAIEYQKHYKYNVEEGVKLTKEEVDELTRKLEKYYKNKAKKDKQDK